MNFVDCESFLKSSSTDIIALYETNLDGSIDSGNFFVRGYLPLIQKCTVFDFISSNIDEVLSINPSANVLVFEDLNVHHKDWITYSGGTDRFGELCYNFSISNDLTRMVNFPSWIPD